MQRKKIIFFIYEMGAGGAARTLLNILNHIDRTIFEPILVTLNYNGSYESYLKSDVKLIKLPTKRLRAGIIPFAKVIRKERPRIVFSTIPIYNTIAIIAKLLSFTKTKNIVREAAYLGGSFSTNVKMLLFGLLYRLSSKVIALSEGVKENIINRYFVKPDKIDVIYNPVDLENIKYQIEHGRIDPSHEALFDTTDKIIVTAGRLVQEKDQRTLLNAFAIVRRNINCKLIILGEGELKDVLIQEAISLGIEEYVHFVGFVRNPYIYFKKADVFALSSINEGFGHVLVEALAAGTPVVSTNCKPGSKEVLLDGVYGAICPVGDAKQMANKLHYILTLNDKERNELINKGKMRAQDIEVGHIVKQYETTFLSVLDIERATDQN